MENVYLGLGANLGTPLLNLEKVLIILSEHANCKHVKYSGFYKTSPVGHVHQPDFINAVCSLKTSLDIHSLFHVTKEIEGLFRIGKKLQMGPRHMDIDILFFGTHEYHAPHFHLPHPSWRERLFVLVPLRELTSTITLPSGEILGLDPLIERVRRTYPNDRVVPLETQLSPQPVHTP